MNLNHILMTLILLVNWTTWYLNEKLIFLQVVFGPACINHEFKTVNRPIAEDGFWKKRRKSYYVILPNFFPNIQILVQNAEIVFAFK
jgi:hypothetical protein